MPSFPSDLRGRTTVVTGAGMGLGRCIALRLAKEGCNLALCDIDLEALQGVKRECEAVNKNLRATVHKVDVSKREEVRKFGADVAAAHAGGIHLLFNNAGIHVPLAWDVMSEADFDNVMSVNLGGVVNMTRVFWPHLVAADAAMIVNISSAGTFIPQLSGNCIPYATSKSAVKGFTECLVLQAQQLAPHVKVAVVHPGPVNTELYAKNFKGTAASVDMRMLGKMPDARVQELEAMDDAGKVAWLREEGAKMMGMISCTAEVSANYIVDGVKAGKTRILPGWDVTIIDYWTRLRPHIWSSSSGANLVLMTGIVGRHFWKHFAVMGVATLAALTYRFRRRFS